MHTGVEYIRPAILIRKILFWHNIPHCDRLVKVFKLIDTYRVNLEIVNSYRSISKKQSAVGFSSTVQNEQLILKFL